MDASGGDPAIELLPDVRRLSAKGILEWEWEMQAGREHDEHEHEPGGNIVQLGDDGGDPTDEDGVQEQGGAHLVNIIKCQIEAPVQDLLHSGLCPAAEGIQQGWKRERPGICIVLLTRGRAVFCLLTSWLAHGYRFGIHCRPPYPCSCSEPHCDFEGPSSFENNSGRKLHQTPCCPCFLLSQLGVKYLQSSAGTCLCAQDISMMLQDMNATQGIAEAEKAAIDSELERIQHLVRSFQERMNAVRSFSHTCESWGRVLFPHFKISISLQCPLVGSQTVPSTFFSGCQHSIMSNLVTECHNVANRVHLVSESLLGQILPPWTLTTCIVLLYKTCGSPNTQHIDPP
eukprot:1146107-Pelagomonas_calceolata.AAC.1